MLNAVECIITIVTNKQNKKLMKKIVRLTTTEGTTGCLPQSRLLDRAKIKIKKKAQKHKLKCLITLFISSRNNDNQNIILYKVLNFLYSHSYSKCRSKIVCPTDYGNCISYFYEHSNFQIVYLWLCTNINIVQV